MSETIVFFGSGPVAARSLELLQPWCEVEAVITKPQPPHHKEPFPVIDIAQKYELPILPVSNRQELDELVAHKSFASRIGVLIDFGIIVSQKVIGSFELGIVNNHFSILPEWRGADPITFAILSGQKQTGVSLMLLVPKMDEGPLIAYGEYDVDPDITTPELTEDLIELSNALLEHTLPPYLAGNINPLPQSVTNRKISYSRKLTKEDSTIDWQKPAEQLAREIRAFSGWPKSRTTLANKEVIITKAHATPRMPGAGLGSLEIDKQNGFIGVATSNGTLWIERLKPAGKPEMTAKAFLAGYGNLLSSR
jgi:methionyl-tRNA formyltransferase